MSGPRYLLNEYERKLLRENEEFRAEVERLKSLSEKQLNDFTQSLDVFRRQSGEKDAELARVREERDLWRSELISIAKVYCGCDPDDPDQVEGGLTEGLVYAFLEGAFDAQEARVTKIESELSTLRATNAGLVEEVENFRSDARERWIADLERDRERLDWLIQNAYYFGSEAPTRLGSEDVVLAIGDSVEWADSEAALGSVRAALDAAKGGRANE